MVEKPSLLEYGVGPIQRTKVEAQSWVPQQRRTVGHTDGALGWRGKGLDKTHGATKTSQRRCNSQLARISEKKAVEKKTEPNGTRPTKKPRDLPFFVLDFLEAGWRPTLEIKGDCKTIVDWISGHANLKKR